MPADGPMPEPGSVENTNPGPGAIRAGVFAGSGGKITLENVSVETAIGEGSGLYASGERSVVNLLNGTITTDGSTSHGVLVTHKGTVGVENVTIITKGEHSSALATFRGGGTVTAVGGTYTAFGKYSAGIYSAGNILVKDVVCKSVSDHAAVVEGGSRINLEDSVLWSREKGGVMMYQSFSGDASEGPSSFEMTGGAVSAEDGPIFYVTNTTGSIFLNQVDLYNPSGILLKVLMGAWDVDIAWSKPVQGGTVTLVADNQALPGDIIVDEFSTLDATLKNGTTLTGAIDVDGHGQDVCLTIDATSTWHVTSDSHLTGLTFSDGISPTGITNIIGNGHTVFYSRDASPALGGKTFDLPKGGKLMPE
jgi:3D (Asp-Asp-Asp) domain-containing protein